jgi:hypothetical protein
MNCISASCEWISISISIPDLDDWLLSALSLSVRSLMAL